MRAIFAKFVTAVFGAGLLMTATTALACNTGCAPPAPPERPTPPPPPSMPCNSCGGHHGGDTNVNVNVNVKTNASASASAQAFGFGSGSAAVYGGGYGNWSQTPGVPQNGGGLVVETGESALENYAERRTLTRTMVIQANCIDDTGVPHPASQLSADRELSRDYMGEVYRCIAGTHMQVTLAEMADCFGGEGLASGAAIREHTSYSESSSHSESRSMSGAHEAYGDDEQDAYGEGYGHEEGGMRHEEHMSGGGMHEEHMSGNMSSAARGHCDFSHVNFDGGKTMTCQKGDALWFDHGALTCKAQIPQRQCNERSLLRRFGAGIKVLTVTRTETLTRQRQISRESSRSGMTVMTFDGGVGGFVE